MTYIWEADNETPFNEFSEVSHQLVNADTETSGEELITFNGRQVRAYWEPDLATVMVTEVDGVPMASSPAFAFVYLAFF